MGKIKVLHATITAQTEGGKIVVITAYSDPSRFAGTAWLEIEEQTEFFDLMSGGGQYLGQLREPTRHDLKIETTGLEVRLLA